MQVNIKTYHLAIFSVHKKVNADLQAIRQTPLWWILVFLHAQSTNSGSTSNTLPAENKSKKKERL